VDLSRKTITILEEQKNCGRDTLPLSESVLAVLKERARVRSVKTDLVFMTGNATRIESRNLHRAFYRARENSNLGLLPPNQRRH
jgi:hypothetical protein